MNIDAVSPELTWVTARELAAAEFCARAAILVHEEGQRDDDFEDELGPRLDYMPDFETPLIEKRLNTEVRACSIELIASLVSAIGLIAISVAFHFGLLSLFALLAVVAYKLISTRMRSIDVLSRQLSASRDALPVEPDPSSTEMQPVNWWSLLKAGLEPIEYQDSHADPELCIGGRPWRVLQRGPLRIPVFRKRSGKPEVRDQQVVRLAAYCQLLETSEGATSPYGIVIFTGGYDGVTVPFTESSREMLRHAVGSTREIIDDSKQLRPFPHPPSSTCCNDCPFGKPTRAKEADREQQYRNDALSYLTRGVNGSVYQSRCGNRFRWVPPHAQAKKQKLL